MLKYLLTDKKCGQPQSVSTTLQYAKCENTTPSSHRNFFVPAVILYNIQPWLSRNIFCGRVLLKGDFLCRVWSKAHTAFFVLWKFGKMIDISVRLWYYL